MNSDTVMEIERIYRRSPWASEKRLRTLGERPDAAALLRYARALIESPERYTARPAALKPGGRPAFATDPEAASFNVHGALTRAARTLDADGPPLDDAREILKEAIAETPQFTGNDPSHAAALTALDKALRTQADRADGSCGTTKANQERSKS